MQTQYAPALGHATQQLAHAGLSPAQSLGAVTQQLIGQAYLLASTELFWACGWLSLAMIGLVWLSRRPAPPTGPIAAD